MLKKLQTFGYVLRKSTFSLSYYPDIVRARFKFSLKYFWFFSLFIGLFMSLGISTAIVPAVNSFLTKFTSRLNLWYPQDLVITLKSGEISTNAVEPIHFPIPYELFTDTPPAISDQKQIYLLTIDTQATTDDFANSQSLILITKNKYLIKTDSGGYETNSLSGLPDYTLDQQTINKLINKIQPVLRFLPVILVIVIFMFFILLLPLSRLINLLFLSLLLLLFTKLFKLNLSYKKVYQIGLHSMTLPTLIQIAMLSFGFSTPLPFFNSILFLLYTMAIFAELGKHQELKTKPAT